MPHIAKNGIRFTCEPDGSDGNVVVKSNIDSTMQLLSAVILPREAAGVVHAALGEILGAEVAAEVVDVAELKVEARAAAVADLQAEHDAEVTKLREQIAKLGSGPKPPAPRRKLAAVK